jgi:hypothetical protein
MKNSYEKVKGFVGKYQNAIKASVLAVGGMLLSAGSAFATSVSLTDTISGANSGFVTATGLTDGIAGVVTWAGTNLYMLFVGSGLAVLYNLRYWIVALVIISAIIYFAFRAFRFFRH